MSPYRNQLPQLQDELFMADGGLETTLIFHEGMDLPYFAAFDLLKDEAGTAVLERYYARYAQMAKERHIGAVLETPTWRASSDWGKKLGYDAAALAEINRKSVELLADIRSRYETDDTRIVISGNLGPRGDGYRADKRMTAEQAKTYHLPQIEVFARTDADMVAAFTMNYAAEAIGIVAAAKSCGMPVAISFTLETDGRLPSGETLEQAIRRTDETSGNYPVYYLINCAHPSHFDRMIEAGGDWIKRIRGLRANASRRSHAELDESSDLDIGDIEELGLLYAKLQDHLPRLTIVGGCCGTDHRHLHAICQSMTRRQNTRAPAEARATAA